MTQCCKSTVRVLLHQDLGKSPCSNPERLATKPKHSRPGMSAGKTGEKALSKAHLSAATLLLLFSQTALPPLAFAADKDDAKQEPPAAFRQVVACRNVQDSAARLACYDQQVAALEQAATKREIVIADKKAVETAQRGLFGFATPVAKLMGFGGNDEAATELKEITTKVSGVSRSGSGWLLDFADGSTWEQNDTRDFVLSPKVGNDATISRGILGTFTVSVRGQRPIKMRRVK
ncbi:hypothetical protein NTCA1_02130 [Novosphingobium sp. TCA1]|nr:hypothetical protein NTCA1_02130 [Novosphingobium sp. TCA1]